MKHIITIVVTLFISVISLAQDIEISGTVTDESGLPLPSAIILVKGTTNGTSTDFDGNYKLKVAVSDTIVFSYVGYKTEELIITKDKLNYSIQLEQNTELEEVVVTSFAIKREAKFVGHHTKVTKKSLSTIASGIKVKGGLEDMMHDSEISQIQSGQLTAGEIRDLLKWKEWLSMQQNCQIQHINTTYGFGFTQPLLINVTNNYYKALANVKVKLFDEHLNLIMNARTDSKGQAYVFKDAFNAKPSQEYTIQIISDDIIIGKKINSDYNKNVDFKLETTEPKKNVDIMFTIDATGSMGDEMNYLKAELAHIIETIDTSVETKRLALTFYRDRGDAYVTKPFNFSEDIIVMQNHLRKQNANGGGDYEEAVEEALKVSMQQNWNEKATTKLLFLLLDAPPHVTQETVFTIKDQIKIAQQKGIKIIPIVASDANKNVEFLMRYFAISTNGTYVFLTDDSGIGNSHIKPTTKDFKVEKLNNLIIKLIKEYTVGI